MIEDGGEKKDMYKDLRNDKGEILLENNKSILKPV